MIRKVLEKLMRNWVFRRRLPADFNYEALYVSPSAGLRFVFRRMSSIDPPLLRCARELVRNGDVIWDIGANVGLFSVAAAARSGTKGRVIAFEPDACLVKLLGKTKALQQRSNAHLTIV